MLIQIDDFYTDDKVDIEWLVEMPIEVRLSVLLSKSRKGLIQPIRDIPNVTVGVHGWNHFIEPSFGYWQARHLLETADSWECFDKFFVMPWNKMPGIGFMKALRETDYVLITPYKWQVVVARVFKCNAFYSMPDFLLHPPDLLLKSAETKEKVQTKYQEWKQ